MWWMHTNPVIQYFLTVLESCGALIFLYFNFFIYICSDVLIEMFLFTCCSCIQLYWFCDNTVCILQAQ